MKPPLQVLSEVRDLFKDRKKWTQHAYARDKNGYECNATDPFATCWCLAAAILIKAGGADQADGARRVLYDLIPGSIVGKNDDEGYDAVMALLDKAIAHVQN
jgi:hypothetical protein